MTTWAKVRKGDVVKLSGRWWTVAKVKRKGKKAKVTVAHKGREASSTVKLADRVKIAPHASEIFRKLAKMHAADIGPLQDAAGAQTRWATDGELKKALAPGDPARTKPPKKAKGPAWDEAFEKGTVEKRLAKVLSARLVGETKNEAEGYYVPPVDTSTVAAHLALFHGGIPGPAEDEGAMLRAHAAQHDEAAKRGVPLAVNHWHEERRP